MNCVPLYIYRVKIQFQFLSFVMVRIGVCIVVFVCHQHERSYHVNCTRSRPIPEVKLRRVQPVVRCVSTCEAWILFVRFDFANYVLYCTIFHTNAKVRTNTIILYILYIHHEWNKQSAADKQIDIYVLLVIHIL